MKTIFFKLDENKTETFNYVGSLGSGSFIKIGELTAKCLASFNGSYKIGTEYIFSKFDRVFKTC